MRRVFSSWIPAILGIFIFIILFSMARDKVEWQKLAKNGDPSVDISVLSETQEVPVWMGEDVIKLALDASKGKIILVVDGIQIDSEESLEIVNLRGMIGYEYKVSFHDSDQLDRRVVVANLSR